MWGPSHDCHGFRRSGDIQPRRYHHLPLCIRSFTIHTQSTRGVYIQYEGAVSETTKRCWGCTTTRYLPR